MNILRKVRNSELANLRNNFFLIKQLPAPFESLLYCKNKTEKLI